MSMENVKETVCAMCQEMTNEKRCRKIPLKILMKIPSTEGRCTKLEFCRAPVHIFGSEKAKETFTFPGHPELAGIA